MSARTDLVAALVAALDPDVYRVQGTPSCPDQIEVDTVAVRAWASKVAPGPVSGAVQVDLVVWALTPAQTPGVADDVLDVAYEDVMGVLYELAWVTAPTADRGVMDDSDGPRWHGWRFEVSAFGRITMED